MSWQISCQTLFSTSFNEPTILPEPVSPGTGIVKSYDAGSQRYQVGSCVVYVCSFVCLFVCLYVCTFVFDCFCWFVHSLVRLVVPWLVRPCVCPFVCLSVRSFVRFLVRLWVLCLVGWLIPVSHDLPFADRWLWNREGLRWCMTLRP